MLPARLRLRRVLACRPSDEKICFIPSCVSARRVRTFASGSSGLVPLAVRSRLSPAPAARDGLGGVPPRLAAARSTASTVSCSGWIASSSDEPLRQLAPEPRRARRGGESSTCERPELPRERPRSSICTPSSPRNVVSENCLDRVPALSAKGCSPRLGARLLAAGRGELLARCEAVSMAALVWVYLCDLMSPAGLVECPNASAANSDSECPVYEPPLGLRWVLFVWRACVRGFACRPDGDAARAS